MVFDLDGTLVDSCRDIAESVNRALGQLSRPPLDHDRVRAYVGNGARKLMERSLGEEASPELVERALEALIADYADNCLVHTRPYPGVREGLRALLPKPAAVLTNKPRGIARKILAGLGLLDRFLDVVGGDSVVSEGGHPARKPLPDGLLRIVARCGVEPARTLMVGDCAVDVHTARAASTGVAGVTYGFRPDEFRAAPPDYLLDSLTELVAAPDGDREDSGAAGATRKA